MKKNNQSGFTLIELMIVVAVIGILSAIAYPSYTESVLKGKRAQARAAIAELLQQQERYMTQRNCYLGFSTNTSTGAATPTAPSPSTACGGVTASSAPFKTFSGESLSGASYFLTATTCPGTGSSTLSIASCVKVVATPVKSDPKVANLEMTSSGLKTCTGTTTNKSLCWP